MKLYNYFRSSASFRVRIALAIKGVAYDYVPVHLAKGEHKLDGYASISAERLVPMLEVAQGDGIARLSQSMAIIEYLEETHPTPALLPVDAVGRAQVRALAQTVACEIHPLNNLRVLKYLKNPLGVSEEAKDAWYRHWVEDGLQNYERVLEQRSGAAKGPFSHGDQPTLADCFLVPQIFNGKRFNADFSRLPLTMATFEHCMKHPAFDAAQPSRCPDAE